MARITIKDLPESVDLDRHAMKAICGGSRTRGRQIVPGNTIFQSNRVFNYPGASGFGRNLMAGKNPASK